MIIKNIVSNYKRDTIDFIKRDTLTERLRRIRALNAKPSDMGITQYTWKFFTIEEKR